MTQEQVQEQGVVYFSPVLLTTKTPHLEIKTLANSQGVDSKFVDYRLLDILTSYTDAEHEEPVEVKRADLDIFDDTMFYIEPSLKIEQSYYVEFYDIRQAPKVLLPKINIGVNSSLTKIVAKIHSSKDIAYVDKYDEFLYEFIAKQLISAKILVGIREGKLRAELNKISSILRIKEMIDQDVTISVTTGVEPRKPIDARVIFHYKKSSQNQNSDKVDYASRGFLQGVIAGELIIEKIKPKNGRNGRNVRGEFLEMPPVKEDGSKDINVSENIEVSESDESIKYTALKPGFVSENGGVYDIKEELEINEINFKQTGSVQTVMDANVTLMIKESDIFKDAIGTGVVVEAKEINVKGNVAANAVVVADEVSIGGQTHGKAKIKAKKAEIAVHIGLVEGDEVEIDRLEGGTVIAKKVRINSVIGGNITAEEIYIQTLGSNCTMTAAMLIDVKFLRGMNNKFIIDTSKMAGNIEDIPMQLKKIEEAEAILDKLPKKIETKKSIIDNNKSSIYTIKQKVEELQAAKIVPPVTFMKKLKEYQQLVADYNELLKELKSKKSEHQTLKEELNVMQNGIFAARVINRSNWLELNEVKFIVIDPPVDVTYMTKQNEMARVMSLERVGDDKFQIKKSNDLGDAKMDEK
ncbi:flagellar assembly protein A [Campylobacter mucosalis]|uniref:flagellar assembly protein A n=1 Tax=Campylobacter mucosalis TaxID=202 RepID=UPI0014702D8D|nr:flagellar assembly protein A [Campylobacter mucosalis]